MRRQPEPWLRGPIPGVDPLLVPILFTFQQAREDLDRCTALLTETQLWATPYGLGSVAFHLRHIAGSTDRLMTYLRERQLTAEQLAMLAAEAEPAALSREQLLSAM
ncbi:MAG TPA: hypothetical protein VKJ01_07370, partial [Candidatus Solibacter sp.]|nr:hypothetical protein [Candidatus Solibacter sp.]